MSSSAIRARVRLAIVGELNPSFPPHQAVEANLSQVASALRIDIDARWVATDTLEQDAAARLEGFDGLWISPGSPYRSLDGALEAIRHAREREVPLVGTCGGFQHIVLEYARNVMGLDDAAHQEIDPDAPNPFVSALTCSPAGQIMPVTLDASSRVSTWYGTTRISERYYCNYGVNRAYETDLIAAGLVVVGRDDAGEPRVVDLPEHPFFIGALYVPQPSPTGTPHPLIAALVRAALNSDRLTKTSR